MQFFGASLAGLLATCILTTEPALAQWTDDVWPACSHAGKLFIGTGTNMYRQAWAEDCYNALRERAAVLYTNGWTQFTNSTTNDWWHTAAGVRARVRHREGEVLEFLKDRTAELARHFVDPQLLPETRDADLFNQRTEERFDRHQDTIVVTARTGCSGDTIATNDVTVVYHFTRSKTYPEIPPEPLTNFAEEHTKTRNAGTNLTDAADVPLWFFDTHPNRLRAGYCGPAGALGPGFDYLVPAAISNVQVVAVSTTEADTPCTGGDIDVGVAFPYGSTMPAVTGNQSFVTYGEPLSNSADQWLGGVYTGQVFTATTNTFPVRQYRQRATVAITNACSEIASNVVVHLAVSTNLTINGVGGEQSVLRFLRWQDYRENGLWWQKRTMAPGETVEFTLNLEWHRDEEPGTIYPDFGWDSLRAVIEKMDATTAGAFASYPTDTEILVRWWNATGDDNEFSQALNDDVTDFTNAAYSVVTGFVQSGGAEEAQGLDRDQEPGARSLVLAGSFVDGQECTQYWASRQYSWNTVSVTNFAAFVHAPTNFTYSVHVAEQELLRFDWSAVQCMTLEEGTATNSFVTVARFGDNDFPEWPGDPVSVPGPHDNSNYVASTQRERSVVRLFAVLEWDFKFDDD